MEITSARNSFASYERIDLKFKKRGKTFNDFLNHRKKNQQSSENSGVTNPESQRTNFKALYVPERNDKLVYVGNIDPITGKAYQIIKEVENKEVENYTETAEYSTMSGLSSRDPKVFQAKHNNMNLPVNSVVNNRSVPTRARAKKVSILILGLMLTIVAKKRYGTLSPRGIWKQIRQPPTNLKGRV